MAITPPSSYTVIDPSPGGPFSALSAVDTDITNVAANHNLFYAALGTPIGQSFYGLGWTGSGSGYRDLAVYRRPADADQRDLTAVVWAAYSGTGTDGTLRIWDNGGSAATATVLSTATTPQWYTLSWTPGSAAAGEMILQGDKSQVKVYSCTVFRDVLSGSLPDDTPKASGFKWVQTGNISNTEPLRDEMLNRMLAAPWQTYSAQPVCPGCVTDAPTNARLGISSGVSATGPQGWTICGSRHAVNATIWATGKTLGGGAGDVTVTIGGSSSVTLTLTASSAPAAGGPYTWASSAEVALPVGVWPVAISVDGGEVWNVQILTEP